MHILDISIFIVYMLAMLGVGFYFMRKNKSSEDYFVGGRNLSAGHVGLSVVATDVGGGFSIGLGGLGFTMGLSGSWMLFTGLIGAWLSAALLIPKVHKMALDGKFLTFPQLFSNGYGKYVAITAGLISAIGYIGFTSSQILAGAKLAAATFSNLSLDAALLVMGIIAIVYTALGGIKAVIYTDTIQWIILLAGLVLIGLPLGYQAVGGIDEIQKVVDPKMLSLTNITWQDLLNWAVTIIPIWFVGMTLYQRIYSCKDEKQAKRAWLIAGVFEYPVMAFLGVGLGLLAKVALLQGLFAGEGFESIASLDSEMALPLFLKTILPVGLMGLMMSAYLSAIMSTADSCLMAASGNVLTDLIEPFVKIKQDKVMLISQLLTLLIGVAAITLAYSMENVLSLMLKSYAFMVSGLFVPVLAMLFVKQKSSVGAILAMLGGGVSTLLIDSYLPVLTTHINANIYGIIISFILYVFGYTFYKNKPNLKTETI